MMSQVMDYFFPFGFVGKEVSAPQAWKHTSDYILFIEEDSDFTRFIQPALVGNYDIVRACNAREACELLLACPITLIVCDSNPEQFSETLQTLGRVRLSAHNKLPIVIMSSYNEESFEKPEADDPFVVVGFVRKSFSLSDLIKQLNVQLQSFFANDY